MEKNMGLLRVLQRHLHLELTLLLCLCFSGSIFLRGFLWHSGRWCSASEHLSLGLRICQGLWGKKKKTNEKANWATPSIFHKDKLEWATNRRARPSGLYNHKANLVWTLGKSFGSHNYCCTLFVFSARETIFFLQYLCPNKIKNIVEAPNIPQRTQLKKIYCFYCQRDLWLLS